MSPPQLSPASTHHSPDSADVASSRQPNHLPHSTHRSADPGEVSLLILTGCLSAAMIASLACRLPRAHTLSWTTIFSLSIKYIAITAISGAIGTSIPWLFLRARPSYGLRFLSNSTAVGWIFFPCITLFYRQQSPGMFLALSLATVALAFSLRRLFPPNAVSDPTARLPGYASDLPNLYGLPIADFRPIRAFVIAICAQTALILAIAGYLFFAGALLSTSLAMFVWRWTALDRSSTNTFAGSKQSILLCAFAIFFTVLALIPWLPAKLNRRNDVAAHKPALITNESKDSDVPGSDYVGIILWPPPVKKTEIVPPKPHSASFEIGKAAKPVVIPFDGQYWYFKAPSTRPGARAHVAHGRSTYVNVRSTDSAPLLMEAYQNLGTSIDLGCCSEIDVAVTNADVRPGTIALGLRLADSTSLGEPSQELGYRTIVSSNTTPIPLTRPPVDEVLRFPIPRRPTIHRFDEITIEFLSATERARAGAKVSIQTFTLIPR